MLCGNCNFGSHLRLQLFHSKLKKKEQRLSIRLGHIIIFLISHSCKCLCRAVSFGSSCKNQIGIPFQQRLYLLFCCRTNLYIAVIYKHSKHSWSCHPAIKFLNVSVVSLEFAITIFGKDPEKETTKARES